MSGFFDSLGANEPATTLTDPKRLFRALERAPQFKFPHDIQTEVWDRWYAVRERRDVVLKMNTGSGKTVVGLLIARSSLNEGVGPAAYLVPNRQLVKQVLQTAAGLGIAATGDVRDPMFREGEAVLVATVQTAFNGRSKFGLRGDGRQHIDLGTVVIDDAHACIPAIENQFTLTVPRGDLYKRLVAVFEDAIKGQSVSAYTDIEQGDGSQSIAIPYWDWQAKQVEVDRLLNAGAGEEFTFKWPLIRPHLSLSTAAINPREVNVALPYPALDMVPAYVDARRRIYMTATLADDSTLVSKMAVDAETVLDPITPSSASDIGDRIILTPLETSRSISREDVRSSMAAFAERHNVIVIVPSKYRADFWREVSSEVHDKETIEECVVRLQRGDRLGLVVLIGRYDGVDLPGDACRILVLDGLPENYAPIDLVEAAALGGSEAMDARQIQRIEQGMGRGVRSNDDYCAVILLDPRLVDRLYGANRRSELSPGTRAQYELSMRFARNGRNKDMSYFDQAVEAFLARETGWTQASKSAVEDAQYEALVSVDASVIAEREAFSLALANRHEDAAQTLLAGISSVSDNALRGWLGERAASYMSPANGVKAREIQKAARLRNRALLRSSEDTAVLLTAPAAQAESAADWMAEHFPDATSLELGTEALLRDLEPSNVPGTYKQFEAALELLGRMLGFTSSRPDNEKIQNGPDVLWAVGSGDYFIIECKSESSAATIPRKDIAQLSHSVDWFTEVHGPHGHSATPYLVHPSSRLHGQAFARAGSRVITFAKLSQLRAAVSAFARGLANEGAYDNADIVRSHLQQNNLLAGQFSSKWSVEPQRPS